MKYNKKDYIVQNSNCKKLINICFLPFSGNGIYICRRYELGQCPSNEEIKELKLKKNNKHI